MVPDLIIDGKLSRIQASYTRPGPGERFSARSAPADGVLSEIISKHERVVPPRIASQPKRWMEPSTFPFGKTGIQWGSRQPSYDDAQCNTRIETEGLFPGRDAFSNQLCKLQERPIMHLHWVDCRLHFRGNSPALSCRSHTLIPLAYQMPNLDPCPMVKKATFQKQSEK